MNYPTGPGDQWGQQGQPGHQGNPGGFPPPGQPDYGQQATPYGQPYGQPDQQYGGQQYPQTQPQNYQQNYQGQWGQPGTAAFPAGEPPRKGKRGLLIGLVVALVLAVGGGATWFALSQSESVASGSATPRDAALKLASSLGSGDLVGIFGTLAPAEAAMFTDPIKEGTEELKRLGVLAQDANPEQLSGVKIETKNLQFDDSLAERVNDHVTITKLTGGTITVSGNISEVPLSDDYKALLEEKAGGQLPTGSQKQTFEIADAIEENDGEPIRIATVNVDGEWYPSLLYSIADNILVETGAQWPKQSIAPNGAGSPAEAIQQAVQAGLDGNLRRVLELLPPGEMSVLHDVGPLLLEAAGELPQTGAKITNLETEDTEVEGGTRATITALEVEIPGEGAFTLRKEGDCYQMSAQGQNQRMCAEQFGELVAQRADADVPPEFLRNFGSGLLKQGLGIVTVEVDGKHYVSPVRTLIETGMTFVRAIQPQDLKAIIEAAE